MRTLLIIMLIANIQGHAQVKEGNDDVLKKTSDRLFQDKYRKEEIIIIEVDPVEQQEDIRNYRYDVPPKGRELDENKSQEE